MGDVFVLAEHLRGELREVTFEMLNKGLKMTEDVGGELYAILLGHQVSHLAEQLKGWAHKVLLVDDPQLENFNSEPYQVVLSHLIKHRRPSLILIGHTSFGMDLAPNLAVELGFPLITDCIELRWEPAGLQATRQIYGGKINAQVSARESDGYLATVRVGSFSAEQGVRLTGEIETIASPLAEEIKYKRFIQYIEAAIAEVDITQAEIIVAVGRGIGEQENIAMVQELADALGGVVACSRPIVDKKWLPKERQVGTSGKTVKPKIYIALGISGAFQHVAGIKGAGTIIAINKDPKAPIFSVADYGIVDDLFKVIPVLKEKVEALKS
ncbi:MAG: electron transfer flavoprotein subunit alpha/FixB family protein [Deltaproteobacteria bacterium]|nr:MAG: electron transfer flavoprotein subunit alpha/FixB family protein [Deltaproteobacteria bacterium]